MADIDYDKLAEAQVRAYKRAGVQAPTGPSSIAAGEGGKFSEGLAALGRASVDVAKDLYKAGSSGLDTWRQLSKAGSNFSNSIDGMTAAAFESRMNLREFADVVTQNGKNLAGLGGSVTRGTEAFAKLSKGFFDTGMTNELRQLGFTSKELNEVLAIQAGTQRSTLGMDAESRRKSYDSAAALAREMDMISKLTGKNREQQQEEAKKRATDGQVEARLRLIGIEQGAEAEAAARAAFQKQFAEAEARGMGQMAKEMFATGTVTSDEAATQYALLGEAAQKTGEQMKYLADGNIKAAEAASKEANAANAKNQRDPTLLRLATLGDAAGTAGNIMKKNVEDNMALHDSIMAVSKTMKPGLTDSTASFGKALDQVRGEIERSSRGVDASGRQVSGVTRGAVAVGTAVENVAAGAASAAMQRDAEGNSIAGAAQKVGMGVDQNLRSGGNIATGIEQQEQKGVNPTPTEAQSPSAQREASGGIVGAITQGLSKGVNIGAEFINSKILNVDQLPARAEGGYVGKPEIALIGEKGPEFVLNHAQMKGLIDNVGKSGIGNLVEKLPKPPKFGTEKSFGEAHAESIRNGMKAVGLNQNATGPSNINIAELSKTISTTISSTTGGETTTRRTRSKDSTDAEGELQGVKEKYAEERSALAAKFKEMMPDATIGERRRAMNASDEGKALNEKYDALMKPLEKRIKDGIKWEVETKQFAVEEVKKVAEEELKVVKISNAKIEEENKTAFKATIAKKEEERTELIKQADLAKSVIGTSVKGLHDDAIKALLPLGSKIEDFYVDIDGNLQSFAADSVNKLEKTVATASEMLTGIPTTEADIIAHATAQAKPAEAPKAAPAAAPKMPSVGFDLNALNLPGFGPPIRSAATVAPTVRTPLDVTGVPTTEAEIVAAAKKTEAKPEAKPEGGKAGARDATLSDLLMSLNHLNKSMGQLIAQQEEIGRKQIQATQANSSNVYAKQ